MQCAFLRPQLVYKQKQESVHHSLPVCQVYLRSVRKENYDPIKRTRKSLAAVPTIMKNTEWNQGLRRHSTETTKDEQARWRAEQAAIPRACQILPGGHKDLKDDVFLCLQVCQCENYKDYSKACRGSCFFVASTQAVWDLLSRGPDTCTSAALPWELSQKTALLSLTRWFCSFWWARGPICLPHLGTQLPNAESMCLCFDSLAIV